MNLISTKRGSARVQLFMGPGKGFEERLIALPDELAPGELLVKISLATICGSDLHTLEGRRSAPTPCILGHEAVGVVIDGCRAGIEIGQRVTWSLADHCGSCSPCADWRLPQKCRTLFKYGHAESWDGSGLNGCYASHILIRQGTAVFPVSSALSDAMVAPANCALATVMNALSELPDPCRSVLVQGGGLLGIYACAVLKKRGIGTVFCADVDDLRLRRVESFGGIPLRAGPWQRAREELQHHAANGVDAVLEVAGVPGVVPQGIEVLRPGGVYVFAGMVHPASVIEMTGESIIRKCLTLRGVHNYAPEHLAEALAFLESTINAFPYDDLVSPALPLASLEDAMRLAQTRRWLRVAIQP